MPIIQITMLGGRKDETIESCMCDVAQAVQKSIDIPFNSRHVIVNEVPKNRFSVCVQLKSKTEY